MKYDVQTSIPVKFPANSQIPLQTLRKSTKILYDLQRKGIFTVEKISKDQVILEINSRQCISVSTIDQKFRELIIEGARKYNESLCSPTQEKDKKTKIRISKSKYQQQKIHLSKQSLLLLYLLELRCRFLTRTQIQKLMPNSQFQFTLKQWFKTANSSGFVNFERQIIRQSNDQDLWIQYNAYFNHQKQVSQKYHKFFKFLQKQNNQLFKNTSICQYLAFSKQDFEEWHKNVFIWTNQFKNTRAFGYTKETTMIPYFDYMNYKPIEPENEQKQQVLYDGSMTKFKSCLITQTMQYVECKETNSQKQKIQLDKQKDSSDSQQVTQSESDQQTLQFQHGIKHEHCAYLIQVSSDIPANQQIFFSYGALSNNYLLKWYGFTIQNNYFDKFAIYVNDQFNYSKQNKPLEDEKLIFFTKIHRYKRCNLKMNQINVKLLGIMRESKCDGSKNFVQQQIFMLERLYKILQKCEIPKGNWKQQATSNQKQLKQINFIKIYQKQNLKIYHNQIAIIKSVKNILKDIQLTSIQVQNVNKSSKQLRQLIYSKLQQSDLLISNIPNYIQAIFEIQQQ